MRMQYLDSLTKFSADAYNFLSFATVGTVRSVVSKPRRSGFIYISNTKMLENEYLVRSSFATNIGM